MPLLVTFKAFSKRADAVGMVRRLTGGVTFTTSHRESTAAPRYLLYHGELRHALGLSGMWYVDREERG